MDGRRDAPASSLWYLRIHMLIFTKNHCLLCSFSSGGRHHYLSPYGLFSSLLLRSVFGEFLGIPSASHTHSIISRLPDLRLLLLLAASSGSKKNLFFLLLFVFSVPLLHLLFRVHLIHHHQHRTWWWRWQYSDDQQS